MTIMIIVEASGTVPKRLERGLEQLKIERLMEDI